MPEYLSPGVYVEEIDTGSKPIEGVSTSTAGVVGLTERGPANVPMLVTNSGDYADLFGGLLDLGETGQNGYLPLAVDGFFRNSGRRLYVTRIVSGGAGPSTFLLHNRGELAGGGLATRTALLAGATEGDTHVTLMDAAGIVATNHARIGDGSHAEWRIVDAIAAVNANDLFAVGQPFANPSALAGPNRVLDYAAAAAAGGGLAGQHPLEAGAGPGAMTLLVHAAGVDLTTMNVATQVLALSMGGPREVLRVRAVIETQSDHFRIQLASPLTQNYPAGAMAAVLDLGLATNHDVTRPVSSGDVCVFHDAAAVLPPGRLIEIVAAAGVNELRRVSTPGSITLAQPLAFEIPRLAPIENVTPADAGATTLLADAAANARNVTLADRANCAVGRILRIGAGAGVEYAPIAAIPGLAPGAAAAGPGVVTLAHGLARAHLAAEQAAAQNANLETNAPSGVSFGVAAPGDLLVLSTEVETFATTAIRTRDSAGVVRVVAITATAATTAQDATLHTALNDNHAPGALASARAPLLQVQALDVGDWGDRLRLSVQDEPSGLAEQAFGTGVIGANRIVLTSLAGVEAGSVLALFDALGQPIDPLVKVDQVNRANSSVTTADPLNAAQIAALGAPGARVRIRSREFRVTVALMQRATPAEPWRGETAEDTEIFRSLSMDPRHSRYVETIIGRIDGPLRISDRRPEGESKYIRVADMTPPPAAPGDPDDREVVRLGPEPLIDILPSGLRRPARHPMTGGDDGIGALSDLDYLGMDDRDPVNRRGIPAMKNVDEISIVAVPGMTSAQVQGALVDFCEEQRYCFAVLDGPIPPDDAIADVQALRQNFDTRQAAVYYPWLTIPDPQPGNLATIAQIPIPPSGHVLGVYARTDIDRGVHKAPANEVVNGITGLARYLNKAEQDILNPYPSNINVIRDFRRDNRGLRVWGARVATSDQDYKYVPVRRLLLFIEKSIETSLNWAVFEPNAEPLWARVRFSISSFLTTVWKNGALEGTSKEQAFFVNCDRSTMTQADIDNGRLICVIGVAVVKPAEFVIIRIGLKAAVNEE